MKNVNVPLIRLLTVRLLQRVPNGVAMEPRTVASRASVALETRCYGMGSHVSDNDPEVLEKAKKRHLEGKSKSHFPNEAPGWEEELATDSEAVVKAERSSGEDADIRKLQQNSINYLREESEKEDGGKDKKSG